MRIGTRMMKSADDDGGRSVTKVEVEVEIGIKIGRRTRVERETRMKTERGGRRRSVESVNVNETKGKRIAFHSSILTS